MATKPLRRWRRKEGTVEDESQRRPAPPGNLVAERRLAAAAEDGIDPSDPDFGRLLKPPAAGAGSTGE